MAHRHRPSAHTRALRNAALKSMKNGANKRTCKSGIRSKNWIE